MSRSQPLSDPMVLSVCDDRGIVRLTLNRPAARNALSLDMITGLRDALASAGADPAARVVVIAASGPVFSSGHDLKEMTARRNDPDRGEGFYECLFGACALLMQEVVTHKLPVIAEVRGVATAAGCQLVASCDLAIASTESRFATPGVNIGLFCSTPMVALSRSVGRKAAMDMLLTGDMIPAEEALRIGLVNRLAAPATLEQDAMALARQIASKPRDALRLGKAAFQAQLEMPLAQAYDHASRVMTLNMLTAEAQEGIGAFIEKRPAVWPSSPSASVGGGFEPEQG